MAVNKTVGASGADYATWAAAITWLKTQLVGNVMQDDYTFTQISDVTSTPTTDVIDFDLGGYTLTFTNNDFHPEDYSQGNRTTQGSTVNRHFESDTGCTNGTIIIEKMHIISTSGGVTGPIRMRALTSSMTIKIRNIQYSFGTTSSMTVTTYGGLYAQADNGGDIDIHNVAMQTNYNSNSRGLVVQNDDATSTIRVENCTILLRRTDSTLCTMYLVTGSTGPVYFRNCLSVRDGNTANTSHVDWSGHTGSNVYGYNCAGRDSLGTAGLFGGAGSGGAITGYVYHSQINGFIPTQDEWACFTPREYAAIHDGGSTPSIPENTAGIRGAARPHGSDYGVGAVETGDHRTATVGPTGDYSTFKAAIDALQESRYGGNLTLTQIGDVTETTQLNVSGTYMGGWTCRFTSDTPHYGRSDQGHLLTSTSTLRPFRAYDIRQGIVEIDNIRFEPSIVNHTGLCEAIASHSTESGIGGPGRVIVHDNLVRCTNTYKLANNGRVVRIGTNGAGGAIDFYNNIFDIETDYSSGSLIETAHWYAGDYITIENNVLILRNAGVGTGLRILQSSSVNGTTRLRNNVVMGFGTIQACFYSMTSTKFVGNTNAATDGTATTIGGGATGFDNIVPATEFQGTTYTTPLTYCVPQTTSQFLHSGSAPDITGNTEGVRGGDRPHGIFYTIGAVEATFAGVYTVGTGQDFSTWSAAMVALRDTAPRPLAADAIFRQVGSISDPTPTSPTGITGDFGGHKVTIEVTTPHAGVPSAGDGITITGNTGYLFFFNHPTNGEVEIKDLRVEYALSYAKRAFQLFAGVGFTAKLHDILHYCPDAYVAPDYGIQLSAPVAGSYVYGWNIISDLSLASAYRYGFWVNTGSTGVLTLENCVSKIRSGANNYPFFRSGATGPLTLRNCYGDDNGSAGNCFHAFSTGNCSGYNNGAVDSTATAFAVQAGGQNGLVSATEFQGTDYSTPGTYWYTVSGSTVANGGQTPTITGNTEGIHGNARPHGSYVSIGAHESKPVISSGLHTVGTGADWPDWQQALASLVTPTGDITLRQVAQVNQSVVAQLPSNLFNLAGYKLTLESDTPHNGRSDTGHQTLCTAAAGCIDLRTNSFQNGEVEIKDLKIEMQASGWTNAVSVSAADATASLAEADVHDILVHAGDAYQPGVGADCVWFGAYDSGSNRIRAWNIIVDIPRCGSSTSGVFVLQENVSGAVVYVENCIARVRNVGSGSMRAFWQVSGASGASVYVRNCAALCVAGGVGSWFTGFYDFTLQNPTSYGYNNLSADATATSFNTTSGGVNSKPTDTDPQFFGIDYATPATYMIPKGGSSVLNGGSAPDIVANTVGIRNSARPHGSLYSIGAVEALAAVSKTVGSGGDYADWNAALTWLDTQDPLPSDHTLTQISDVTEPATTTIPNLDLGTFNLHITSDTPHLGKGNQGWGLESHAGGISLTVGNGQFEIDDLKLETTGTGWTRMLKVYSLINTTGKVHDLLLHGADAHVSAGVALDFTAEDSVIETWNIIADVMSDVAGSAHEVCALTAINGGWGTPGKVYLENSDFVNRQTGAGGDCVTNTFAGSTVYLRNVAAINRGTGTCFTGFLLGGEGRNCASTDASSANFGVIASPIVGFDPVVEFDGTDWGDEVNYFNPTEGQILDDDGVAPAISDNATGIRGNPRPHLGGLYAVGAVEIAIPPDFTITGTVEAVVTVGGSPTKVEAYTGTPAQRAEELGYRPSSPIRVYSLSIETESNIVAAQVPDRGHFCMSASFTGGPGNALFDAGAKPGYIGTKNGSLYAFRAPTEFDVVWHVEKTLDADLVDHGLYRWQTGSDLHWAPYKSWPERAFAGTRAFDQLDPDKVYDYYGRLMGATMTQWNTDTKTILTFIDPDDCPEEFLPYLANNVGARLRADEDADVQRERIKNAVPISKAKSLALAVVIRLQELGYEGYAMEIWANPDNPANYEDDDTGEKGTDYIERAHGTWKDEVFIGYRFLGALNPLSGTSVEISDYTTDVTFSFGAGAGTIVAIGADAWETLDNLITAVNASALTIRARLDALNDVEPTMILNGGKILSSDSRTGQVHNPYYPSSRVSIHVNNLSGEPIDITRAESVLDALKEDIARELGIDVFPVYTDIRYFVTDPEVGGDFGVGEELEIDDDLTLTEV